VKGLLQRAGQARALVRLTPFDTSTEEGRSKERYRRVALSTVVSAGAKGVVVLTTLVSVPLTVGYLGPERYGLWMTISATIAMLGFGDLGIGLGLLNLVSEADGKDDRGAAARYVSSGFFMLLGVTVFFLAGFALVYPIVPWARFFNVVSELAARESGPAVAVFVVCFALNIPLWAVNRVHLGYQEGFVNSFWEIAGNVLGLMGILLAIYLRAGLPWLVLAMSGPPALASLANGAILFGVRRPWLLPRWRTGTREAALKIFRLGFLFFVLQLTGAIAYSSDNIIAARVLGAEAVTQYSVPMKMFSFVPMMMGMILIPLWPAYGEAIARGDVTWVRSTLSRSVGLSLLVAVPVSVPLVLWGGGIIRLWVGSGIAPSFLLLSGLGMWAVMSTVWGAVVMFLNGANALRVQVASALLMGVGALVTKYLLARSIGLPGIIWGTIAAQSVFVVLPMAIYIPRLLFDLGRSGTPVGTDRYA